MSGKTPNLPGWAAQGMMFTDYYAEASCTAGRANFITGELPIRTGMTTVGQAGADVGLRRRQRSEIESVQFQGVEGLRDALPPPPAPVMAESFSGIVRQSGLPRHSSVSPEVLEPVRRQRRVDGRAGDPAMAEPAPVRGALAPWRRDLKRYCVFSRKRRS
jgi:hypothetical protein